MKTLDLVLSGNQISPSTFPLKQTIDVLDSFRKAVESFADYKGLDLSHDTLSLVGVEEGSCRWQISMSPSATRAIKEVSDQFASGDFSDFPEESLKQFSRIRTIARKNEGEFNWLSTNQDISGSITGSTKFPKDSRLRSRATVQGTVIRVSGEKNPKGQIRLLGQQKKIGLNLEPQQAIELATRFLQDVEITGEATYALREWDILEITVETISDFQKRNPRKLFEDLGAVDSEVWDNCDPDDFMNRIRRGA